jgi:hypothetical protein
MSDTELLHKSQPVRRVEVFTGVGRRGWRRAARRRAQESGVAFAPVLVGPADAVPEQP